MYALICYVFYVCLFFLMIRLPPRSTRTDTLFPYTTLFRSWRGVRRKRFPHSHGMTMTTPSDLLTAMIEAARVAGDGLMRDFAAIDRLDVRHKNGPADPFSEADLRAEETVRAMLAREIGRAHV